MKVIKGKLDYPFHTGVRFINWTVDWNNYIEEGDYLKIFDKNSNLVWEGIIEWEKYDHPYFAGFSYKGTPAQKQKGFCLADWSKYFQGEYTGELTKK